PAEGPSPQDVTPAKAGAHRRFPNPRVVARFAASAVGVIPWTSRLRGWSWRAPWAPAFAGVTWEGGGDRWGGSWIGAGRCREARVRNSPALSRGQCDCTFGGIAHPTRRAARATLPIKGRETPITCRSLATTFTF